MANTELGGHHPIDFAPPDTDGYVPGQAVQPESGDDRPSIPMIGQEHGPVAPSHGAAGGLSLDWNSTRPGATPGSRPTNTPTDAVPLT